MSDFKPTFLPLESPDFFDLSTEERRMIATVLTTGQVQHMLEHRANRTFVALVKELARRSQTEFFSGTRLPAGLENASAREAYFAGLVNAHRAVLDLQRQMWVAAVEKEAPEPAPAPRERQQERDVFTDEPLGAESEPE